MVLLRLPVLPEVEPKKMMPDPELGVEALMVQYFTVLLQAPLIKRMAEIPADTDVAVLVFVMTRSFVLPVALTLPSMVTLSAPLRSMRGKARLPLIVSPVFVGYMFTEV